MRLVVERQPIRGREARQDAQRLLHVRILDRLLLECDVADQGLMALCPCDQLLRRLPDDVVLRLRVAVRLQRPVRDRLDEQHDPPDVVDREPVAEVLHCRSRPAAQDSVVEVAGAGIAAAAGVVGARKVRRRRREEGRARTVAIPFQPMTADAAVEEDLLAAEQVCLGHRQRVGGEPVAPVDLREVGRLRQLAVLRSQLAVGKCGDDRLMCPLEARVRRREALVRKHHVLRVELAGVA